MKSLLVFLLAFTLISCDRPSAPAASATPPNAAELQQTQGELAAARDALQRQALEIETKTALMDKQLAEMEKSVQEHQNAELRGSLDALKRQNDDLRAQADAARRQSQVVVQKIMPAPRSASSSPVPRAVAALDYSLFYERLSPFGRWLDVGGYGYCWRPTITTSGWRPYLDGCWVWSSLGWTWQSNEPFGWAVYHYGRWVNLSRYGWVWVPGGDWAPAWVAWRQSRDCVGWAPLPPEQGVCGGVYRDCDAHYHLGPSSYAFIPSNRFTQPSYTTMCAPVTQNTVIFQRSVNVTQIVRCDDHARPNVFMHHGGPPRAQMEQACAQPVPQVQVVSMTPAQLPPPSHHAQHHSEMPAAPVIVDLPALQAAAPPVRPHITEHVEKPQPVDAFAGVPKHTAAEIRQTITTDQAAAVVQRQPVVVEEVPAAPVIASTPAEPVVMETVRPAIAVTTTPSQDTPPTMHSARHGPQISEPSAAAPAVEMPVIAASAAAVTSSNQPPQPVVIATPVPSTPSTVVEPIVVVAPAQPTVATVTSPESTPVAEKTPPPLELTVMQTQPVPQSAPVITEAPNIPPQIEAAPSQQQRQDELAAQQRATAEKQAAEQAQADKARAQAEAIAMQQRQQDELAAQQRATAEKQAAEQAQAEAAAMQQRQQNELAAQQRAMAEKAAAEQAQAAEAEKARAQAEAVAMQQRQQDELASQQRAAAEKMAAEQAQAAAEAERARQQEEAARRAQEMAQQREAEAQARRAAEEQARQQAEAEMRRAQEMAQRQAEEQARRAQEEALQRAAQEAAAMRAAQEAAQRAAEEAARRAAEEAARNQPQPAPPGS